jgi:hypothetical protein
MNEEDALMAAINLPLTAIRSVKLMGDNATELEFGGGQIYLTFPVDTVMIELSERWRPN